MLQEGRRSAARCSSRFYNIRDYATDKHRVTDDTPYGGGQGMVMKPEPLVAAIEATGSGADAAAARAALPAGRACSPQARARALAARDALALVCGRYEGVDERVRAFVDEELSIGDYVLSGGEIAALVVIDAVARLVPGVLGCAQSAEDESLPRRPARVPAVHPPARVPRRARPRRPALRRPRRRSPAGAAAKRCGARCERRPDLLERRS